VVALLVAATSLADSISPTEGEQFSGSVDSSPSCTPSGPITIHWGDGTTSPGTFNGSGIDGTHTYAEEGTYNGSVDFPCATAPASDPLSASVPDASLSGSPTTFNATASQQSS